MIVFKSGFTTMRNSRVGCMPSDPTLHVLGFLYGISSVQEPKRVCTDTCSVHSRRKGICGSLFAVPALSE